MLSIKAIKDSGSAADYYNAADYYVKDDPIASISYWQGKGAVALGLKGAVDGEKLKELLDGKVDGNQLGVVIDGELKHKCGWDLTFSAPKSVSLLALVGNDKRLLEAVKQASNETIKYIEQKYAVTRQMKNGQIVKSNEQNIVCASFVHTTSRELDPQLHIHNVLLNMVKRANGQWRSIESRGIYDDSMLLGLMFRSNLAPKVIDLGYEIEVDPKTGFFEVKGVSREAIQTSSKRRGQIEKLAEDSKISDAKAKDRLNLLSRKSKRQVGKEELMDVWGSEAKAVNFNPASLVEQAIDKVNSGSKYKTDEKIGEIVELSAKALFEMEAVITRDALLGKALALSLGKFKLADVDKAIDKMISEQKICVSKVPLENNKEALTTKESYRVENYILKLSTQGRGQKESITSLLKLDYALKDSGLNDGQEKAVRHITTTNDQVIAIQGYAGTGKTHMLKSAAKIIQDRGYNVMPLGAYNSSSNNLQKELNVQASTVASYINGMENKLKENPGYKVQKDVLILDEAGQVNAKDMASLLTIVRKTKSRLVMVGDKAQIGAVEWGKPFNLMLKNGVKYTEMTEIKRQNDEQLKQAVLSAINHDYNKSIELLKKDAIVHDKEEVLKKALVDDYFKLNRQERDNTLIIIPDNKTRFEIMQSIREKLVVDGTIKGDTLKTTVYGKCGMNKTEKGSAHFYNIGQIVEFNKEYTSLGIGKNEKLKVVAIDRENGIVNLARLKDDNVTTDNTRHQIKWEPSKVAGRARNGVEVYDAREIVIGVGDKIIWNKTDKDNDLKNGDKAEVIKISGDKIELKFNDKLKTIDTLVLKNFDYAYAATAHIAQGMTYDRAFVLAQSYQKNLVNQKSFYVSISRAREITKLYTDNLDKLTKALHDRVGDKTSSLESLKDNVKDTYLNSLAKLSKDILNTGTKLLSRINIDRFYNQRKELVTNNTPISEKNSEIISINTNYSKKEIIDAKEVDALLKNNATEVAQRILGKYNKKVGSNIFFGKNKGSLAVTISGKYAGTWKDFDSGEKGNLITLIQKQYGLNFKEALGEAAKLVNYMPGGYTKRLDEVIKNKANQDKLSDKQKLSIKTAQKLAQKGKNIEGTIAEKYLKDVRGISLDKWPCDLKYHEGVYSKINKGRNPALLVIARDKDNKVQSVQAIYLNKETARKADVEVQKQTFGALKGALFSANTGDNNRTGIVCEGPEDALSIFRSTSGKDVYACLGKSNFNNLNQEKLAKYDKIILALDNDGQKPSEMPHILNTASKLASSGKHVILSQPNSVKQDYNDLLKSQGAQSVYRVISNGISFNNSEKETETKIDVSKQKAIEKEF